MTRCQPLTVLTAMFFVLFTRPHDAAASDIALDWADDPQRDMRLIRTGHGSAWMTPEEVLELARQSHADGHCGGFMDITHHALPAARFIEPTGLAGRVPKQMAILEKILPNLRSENIVATVKTLQAFNNRHYKSATGEAAALWIRDTFAQLANGRPDVTVELFNHEFRQPSVIVRIAGKGKHAHEKVILGAHEDSINWESRSSQQTSRAPGADDNASGVAVLLEVFRGLMASDYHPERTVEFMTYAGEELGLLGSQDVAEAYYQAKEKVVGVLQMDMTLYPASDRKVTFITDNVSHDLTLFAQRLMDTYVQKPWQESRCGYACSDHASWHDQGYPAVFPFETSMHHANPDIHSERDTLANLDGDFGLQFAKLNTAFAVEMAAP